MHAGGVSATLKDSLPYGLHWKKGNDFGYAHLQLSIGYEWINTKRINIIPFVSGGLKSFRVTEKDNDDESSKTKMTPSYSIGFALDFKINSPVKVKNKFPGSEYEIQYFYVRILSGVFPNYFENPLNVGGMLYYINLSIGAFWKPHRKK